MVHEARLRERWGGRGDKGFNEVWWFYCSAGSTVVNKYVIFNYLEKIWYYGTMGRTAWLDSGLLSFPIAATYINNIVNHEDGVDDNSTAVPTPIAANIEALMQRDREFLRQQGEMERAAVQAQQAQQNAQMAQAVQQAQMQPEIPPEGIM